MVGASSSSTIQQLRTSLADDRGGVSAVTSRSGQAGIAQAVDVNGSVGTANDRVILLHPLDRQPGLKTLGLRQCIRAAPPITKDTRGGRKRAPGRAEVGTHRDAAPLKL